MVEFASTHSSSKLNKNEECLTGVVLSLLRKTIPGGQDRLQVELGYGHGCDAQPSGLAVNTATLCVPQSHYSFQDDEWGQTGVPKREIQK